MDNGEFKKHAHEVLDWMADYFKNVESYPVKSPVRPKDIYKQIPATAPAEGESFETIFDDFKKMDDPKALDQLNITLLENLNMTEKVYLSHTKLNDVYTIRMCIGQTEVEKRHVDAAWDLIVCEAGKLKDSFVA